MEATAKSSSLNEWAQFLAVLNNREPQAPLIPQGHNPYRLVTHLEQKFPVVRKYRTGKQLALFSN